MEFDFFICLTFFFFIFCLSLHIFIFPSYGFTAGSYILPEFRVVLEPAILPFWSLPFAQTHLMCSAWFYWLLHDFTIETNIIIHISLLLSTWLLVAMHFFLFQCITFSLKFSKVCLGLKRLWASWQVMMPLHTWHGDEVFRSSQSCAFSLSFSCVWANTLSPPQLLCSSQLLVLWSISIPFLIFVLALLVTSLWVSSLPSFVPVTFIAPS